MSTKVTITLTCDICQTIGNDAYGWARVNISGSSGNAMYVPDSNYDICMECWGKHVHRIIHPPRGGRLMVDPSKAAEKDKQNQ